MKCPACQKHELRTYAWLAHTGGQHKDHNFYECYSCGPVHKSYVDLIQDRIDNLIVAIRFAHSNSDVQLHHSWETHLKITGAL